MKKISKTIQFTALLALVASCDPDSPCDDGYLADRGVCRPVAAEPPGDAATHDAQADDDDGGAATGDGTCSETGYAHYGDECMDTSDCACPTNYCGIQPGAMLGTCTHTGCKEDMTVCPPDWECLDLSVFDPSLPSICTKP